MTKGPRPIGTRLADGDGPRAASRVPQRTPVRYCRMLVSPFTFYRDAALIMASDLATSFEIMGRDRGFSPADRRAIVMAGVAEFRVPWPR